jgi:DNA-binding NtrC family response regulator
MKKQASIIIVVNDATRREMLAAFLAAKYDCKTAAGAEEAIGILAFWNFEVLITDRTLPGLSSFALCQFIQRKCPETAIIILSERISEWHRTLAEWLGVFECVGEPCDLLSLSASIERALHHNPHKKGPEIITSAQSVYKAI